jgi:hypothetical protein
VCPECGRAEPEFGKGFTEPKLMKAGRPIRHNHPLEMNVQCDGQAVGRLYFGHNFPTDVLLMKLRFDAPATCATGSGGGRVGQPGRAALVSVVEALCLAASRALQIDEEELSGNWSPLLGGGNREVQLFLYDLLPGGAGYTKLVKDNLTQVLETAEAMLVGCDCDSSCYRCLRHYGNTQLHASLDRRLALSVLRYLRDGAIPNPSFEEKSRALDGLVALLDLKGVTAERSVHKGTLVVPLVLTRGDGAEVWVDVHHPLVDPETAPSVVKERAESEFLEFCSLDTFVLRHDLPFAVSKLNIQ